MVYVVTSGKRANTVDKANGWGSEVIVAKEHPGDKEQDKVNGKN